MRKKLLFPAPLLALFMLVATAGAASANHEDPDVDESSSVVEASDNNVQVPAQACHNHVPVNALGVQVPIQEIAAAVGVPVLAEDTPSSGPDSSCNQASAQHNEGDSGQENPRIRTAGG